MDAHNSLQQLRKAAFRVLDPGNAGTIEFDRNFGYCALRATSATSGAETRTMPAPNGPGRTFKIGCTYYGNGAITVTVKDSAAATTGTIAFSALAQWAVLESVETSAGVYAWNVASYYGCTPTTIPAGTSVSNMSAPVITGGLTASGSAAHDFSGSTGAFKTSSGANTLSGTVALGNETNPAAGGLTGGKTALTKQVNVLTCSDGSHVFFTLPAPATFQFVVLINISAQAADIYPNASETIKNTTHLTIAAYTTAVFWTDGTNWFTQVSG
jgi:hypothetical protein